MPKVKIGKPGSNTGLNHCIHFALMLFPLPKQSQTALA